MLENSEAVIRQCYPTFLVDETIDMLCITVEFETMLDANDVAAAVAARHRVFS